MAHCQLNGPLHGPLRERRRSTLSKDHPAWELTRGFLSELNATTQQIRRTPGLPATLSGKICDTLTTHSQLFNNAVREIVDDASEIRIQIEEANQALMTLKVQETAAQHELSQMEKRIQEQIAKVEDTENRLAKYHSDAEKDRNEVREQLAKLNDEDGTDVKEKIIQDLLQTLQKQLEVRRTIWVEPIPMPTEYEVALAAVKEANPGLIPEDTARNSSPKVPPMNPFDAGKYDPARRSTSLGSPLATRSRGNLGLPGPGAFGDFPPTGPYRMQQLPAHHLNGNDAATEVFRPKTPQGQLNHGGQLVRGTPGIPARPPTSLGTPGIPVRPQTSMGQRSFRTPEQDNVLRGKAPEFFPVGWVYDDGNNGREDPNAFVDQMASINLSRGRGPNGSFVDNSTQGRYPPMSNGARPMANGGPSRAMGPPINRPQFGPNQYDNRLVVPRSQPGIPLGQMYGGINDDLSRFRVAFSDLFSMTRGFVANWVARDGNQVNRNAAVIQCLPRCYSGFSEQQAWSYIRQHLQDDLSRSCLFARVVVDFICERIMVPSAWQGFEFQTDRRIQQLQAEKGMGPVVTGHGRIAYTSAIVDVINVIINSDRYEAYRESRVEYFARELEAMLSPLMNQFANLADAFKDLRAMVTKAWSLSAKTLTSRLVFEYRFPDAGSRFTLQSMIAVAPNIDGYQLQVEHWRVQLVVTPVITVRNDNGNTLSVDVTNLAEVLLMK
ncbi:hypothetical protein F5X68DRAFT_157743 [Plectosphaerella plurivora]|uniref:Uncharacterized protein n=1 Tax=Plectosphaerella plurivora TaxID=936078 RepID=A0A9P8V5W3_9PEZI|nr:hypothetical protein F5X68DRAFT_157743 [Plectosphaerella plurivora]